MSKKLYVGNLPYTARDSDLKQLFGKFGEVSSAMVIMERGRTNRSKGFGFVEMVSDDEADMAIANTHEKPYNGRNLIVNEARPLEERAPRERSYRN